MHCDWVLQQKLNETAEADPAPAAQQRPSPQWRRAKGATRLCAWLTGGETTFNSANLLCRDVTSCHVVGEDGSPDFSSEFPREPPEVSKNLKRIAVLLILTLTLNITFA